MRFLAPSLGVLFLAALVGCGGSGGSGFSTTSSTNGGTGSTNLRAPAGRYATTLSGTDDASPATTFSGSGTSTVASDGTITFSYNSVASGASSGTTARKLVAAVATTGAVSGTLQVGSATPRTILNGSSLAKNSSGTYNLTVKTLTESSTTETDVFTLTANTERYEGSNAGADDQGATYSGSGSATVATGNALSLTYTSIRQIGGASSPQTHTLQTTLNANGSFSGTMDLGFVTTSVTGTWRLNSSNVLTLTLAYTNTRYVGGTGRNPRVAETLTLARQ